MDWHKFLREERKRKLETNELMSSGRISIGRMQGGVRADLTEDTITKNKEHITEIEAILTEAGEEF